MKIKSLIIIADFVAVLFLLSCSESLLDEKPPHILATETLYSTYNGFEAGLNGLYALARQERGYDGSNAAFFLISRICTDVTVGNEASTMRFAELWEGQNNPSNPVMNDAFLWLYQTINSANAIISNARRSDVDWTGGSSSADENKSKVIAEASALRAFAYRHLAYGWGDVPMPLKESLGSTIKTDWERTPSEVVRRQIITDFLLAEKSIPVEPTAGRLSKGAIQTYLAEMYLAINKPDSALLWADKAISTPQYKLVLNRYGVKKNQPGVAFMDMFYDGNVNRAEGNTEALWVFQFDQFIPGGGQSSIRNATVSKYHEIMVNGVNPFQITAARGGRGQCRMAPTKYLLSLYEPKDDRFSPYAFTRYLVLSTAAVNAPIAADRLPPNYKYGDTIWFDTSQDITWETRNRGAWPWTRKYEWTYDPKIPTAKPTYNDHVHLRLAETYLLKAEAQFKLNLLTASAETINFLRRRSNASEVSASDININFILEERSRELYLEENRRWTLVRLGLWLERTRLYNHNGGGLITERDKLWPIPQSVIDANLTSRMINNPYY